MIPSYNNEDKILVAVDCIIFGFDKEDLKILLIKRNFEPKKGHWSLMGGFLEKNEKPQCCCESDFISIDRVGRYLYGATFCL